MRSENTAVTAPMAVANVTTPTAEMSRVAKGAGVGDPHDVAHHEADRARHAVAIEEERVHRLEARAAIVNGRGNGALRKIGAVQEAVLRRSFLCHGEYVDQTLWSILDSDWRQTKAVWGPKVLVH